MKNDLKPIYKIIKKQRSENLLYSAFTNCNNFEKKKQKPTDHIRDWRTGTNLAKKILDSHNLSTHKSPQTKSQSASPYGSKKKEKVSTFWTDSPKRGKRNSKSSTQDTLYSSTRAKDTCCSKRYGDEKGKIQKYIKNKQKLDKEKRHESDLSMKMRKEHIKSALNSLQNYQNDKFGQFKHSSVQISSKHTNDNIYTKSSSTSSLHKSKLPTPIYDELEKDGLLEYIDLGNYDHSFLTNLSTKYRNGLNSTVDSGIETGDWYRSLTPDKLRHSYDRMDTFNWSLPPPLPTMSKSTSQIDIRRDKQFRNGMNKTGFHNKLKEKYREQISAYDASSENEVARDSDDGKLNKHSISSESSMASGDLLMSNLDRYLSRMKTSSSPQKHHAKSNTPIAISKKKPSLMADTDQDTPRSKSGLLLVNQDSSRMCLIQDLKDALFNAQAQLNLDNKGCSENLSEKISQAVQNFIKTKESLNSTRAPSYTSPPQSQNSTRRNTYEKVSDSKAPKNNTRSESKSNVRNSKKEISTECEATEMEDEAIKRPNATEALVEINGVKIQIPQHKSTDNKISDDNRQNPFDIDGNYTSIDAYKQDLQSRQQRASELIKLTKDLRKESKRVIRLEKKAFEVTKKFISSVKNEKESISPEQLDDNDPAVVSHINEPPQVDNGSLMRSSQSENDEITISISDITTTLTDQSELEARLLALQSEMHKKKQLVTKLKKRQKDIKRDKIKQKECVLQKQIEMYDDYIGKLQTSIDHLNSRIDDCISEDTHTLNGSTPNLIDLDSKQESTQNPLHHRTSLNNGDSSRHAVTLTQDDQPLKSRRESLDLLLDHNKQYNATDDIDIDNLYRMHESPVETNEKETSAKSPKSHITNVSSPFKIQDNQHLLIDEHKDETLSTNKDNSVETTMDNRERNYFNKEPSNSMRRHRDVSWDELVVTNMPVGDCEPECVLQQLYLKEADGGDINTNVVLDNLVALNTNPFPIPYHLAKCHTNEFKSKSEDKPADFTFAEKIDLNGKTGVGGSFSSKDSVNVVRNNSHSDLSSISSQKSLNLKLTNTDKFAQNILQPINVIGHQAAEQIHYADTIASDGSSIPDDCSFSQCIDDDFLEDVNALKLSPTYIVKDLHVFDDVLLDCPTTEPKICLEPTRQNQESRLYNYNQVDEIVESLFHEIIAVEIKNLQLLTEKFAKPVPKELTIPMVSDYQSTSSVNENVDMVVSPIIEKSPCAFDILQSEDIWELSDLSADDPWKVEIPNSVPSKDNDPSIQNAAVIEALDKKLLNEKVSWLIPLQEEYIDPLIESAIEHFYEARKNKSLTSEEALFNARDILPHSFSNDVPAVTEAEICTALFESSMQQPYVDKRIIFHIVLEVLLEIYSFEKHFPQLPWNNNLSFMVKNNIYSLWKGDRPPESDDLVRKIVHEHLDILINQKNQLLSDDKFASRDESQSKIIRWCIRQQKDDVDKLLITDMRKEENDWIYYDEAEEEVKFQIAEEILNILIFDTVLWMKSISDHN